MKGKSHFIFLFLIFLLFSSWVLALPISTMNLNQQQSKKISLHFQRIAVHDLLQLMAEFFSINLVLSDAISGNISLDLQNVTWISALDVILHMTGLVKKEYKNVIYVTTPSDLKQKESQRAEVETLASEWIKLMHVDVQGVVTILKAQPDLLSKTAQINFNLKNNSLWLCELPEKLPRIKSFIKHLDIPEKQILIEARIVNIDVNRLRDLGVCLKLGGLGKQNAESGHSNISDLSQGRFSLAIAMIGSQRCLDVELAALESKGLGKIIASPKLITQNYKTAVIESGEEIPYQEQTTNGGTSVNFKKAVLSLKVTPQLTPDNRILLQLEINHDKVSSITVNGTPAIQTRDIKTQVVVADNETLVLGGIFEKADSHINTQIPLLGAIPVLGNLFQTRNQQSSRRELLIFVTPRVVG